MYGNICIDPEKSRDQLRAVSKPEWPTLSTVKAGATGIKDLDENEKFQYKLLQKRYERDISEYETSKKVRSNIDSTIVPRARQLNDILIISYQGPTWMCIIEQQGIMRDAGNLLNRSNPSLGVSILLRTPIL
jgi:hypothetical protein